MSVEIELVDQDELLEGLMSLTGNNPGLLCGRLKKVIKNRLFGIKFVKPWEG